MGIRLSKIVRACPFNGDKLIGETLSNTTVDIDMGIRIEALDIDVIRREFTLETQNRIHNAEIEILDILQDVLMRELYEY